MKSVKPSDVPAFLHSSRYYKNLDLDQDDAFLIPASSAKFDTNIQSMDDFRHLYTTLEFWGSDEILSEMLHYALYKADRNELMAMASPYRRHAKYLDAIQSARPQGYYFHVLNQVLRYGILEVLIFLRGEGHHFNQESVLFAIRSGSIPCLRYVLEEGATDPVVNVHGYWGEKLVMDFVPEPKDLAMIRHCIDNGIKDVIIVESCVIAATLGDLDLLQKLRALQCPWDVSVCAKAAGAGHLHCLVYLHENGAPWDENTTAAAAEGQHMNCLTYAIQNGCPDDGRVSVFAIQYDNLEMLVYAHEEPVPPLPWEDDMCMLAALRGSLRCLKYVHEAGCALTMETCAASAETSLECLQYAHERGAPWGPATILQSAIRNYRVDIVDYAFSNGCPLDVDTCLRAIKRNGSADFLKLLFKYNLPLHPDMCRIAAKHGYWKELQLLHEAGCPWTVTTTRDAARHGRLKVLQYAGDRGCPVEVVACSCSVLPEHFGCMKYVFDHHDSTFDSVAAIIHDHFQCFEYAHNNGCPWSKDIIVCAARMGRLQFLKYAFEAGGCPFFKYCECAAHALAESGHYEGLVYVTALCIVRLNERNLRKPRFMRTARRILCVKRRIRTYKIVPKHVLGELHAVVDRSATSFTCKECILDGHSACQCNYRYDGGFALECGKVLLSGVTDDGTNYFMQTDSGHAPAIFRMTTSRDLNAFNM